MKQVQFSDNWNGKLCLDVFTTIRQFNPDKYKLLEKYEICFKGEPIGIADLSVEHYFLYGKLNERTALVDSGDCVAQIKRMMKRFYGDYLKPESPMHLLFFEWTERYQDASVNLFKHRWEKVSEQMPSAIQKEIFAD